ncbi:MAG: hypothetical protein ACKPA7_18755 [Sphaerospermopsis kisseleviana]
MKVLLLTAVRAFAKRAGSISIRATNYQFSEQAIFRMLRPYFAPTTPAIYCKSPISCRHLYSSCPTGRIRGYSTSSDRLNILDIWLFIQKQTAVFNFLMLLFLQFQIYYI